ncbi:Serpentine Receptor, class X family member (srx-82) [Cyanobacterium aponinum PCC 10605]|uniref:Serpentine Receptor, class X family member (Srx-82) n=1 Tax=Cyanobacterium aponinum (strain PCC 10605) TaxID=755178 RepID=K9Z032_CYAAP|nr:Serpentine Receptor, class X family member (srx-82) [Cyanobacterium aponinum PCC 10605]
MNIFAKIIDIKYQKIFTLELKLINDSEFDINLIPSNCFLSYSNNNLSFGICK